MPNIEKAFQAFAAGLEIPGGALKAALEKSEQVAQWGRRKLKITGTFTGGPYRRGTDVPQDNLVFHLVLSPKYFYDCKENSTKLLNFLRNRLTEEYRDTTISVKGGLAIKIKLDPGGALDLVPSIRLNKGGYLVPNGHGGWSRTNPSREEILFKNKDEKAGGRFCKLAKIIKAWNLHSGGTFNPYYLELLVYYRVNDFNKPYAELVHSLLASKRLFLPEFLNCPAVGEGVSSGVLTGTGRKVVEEAYNITGRAVDEKDTERAMAAWKSLLGDKYGPQGLRPR